jgi:hypothetical protein
MLTFVMQEIESEADLCRVKSSVFLREASLALHVEHQVTTSYELNNEE